MSVNLGRTTTYIKVAPLLFWYGIYNDVSDYIQKYDRCQRQNSLPPNIKNEMHSVSASLHLKKLVGLDICSLSLSLRSIATAILLSAMIISLNGWKPIQSEQI